MNSIDQSLRRPASFPDRTAHVQSHIDQSFLDHAVRALKRSGFSVVATAMAIKHSILVRQKEVTVFAPSDASLFSYSNGFRFDFLRHVVPKRSLLADVASVEGTAIETLSPNKSIVIQSLNRDVTVNGVAVRSSEVYRNRWIIVFAVSRSIEGDDDEDEISRRLEKDASEWRMSHEVSPAAWNGAVLSLALAVDGEDLLCPATSRSLRESRVGSGVYMERSPLSTSYKEFAIKLVKSGPSHGLNRGL